MNAKTEQTSISVVLIFTLIKMALRPGYGPVVEAQTREHEVERIIIDRFFSFLKLKKIFK